MTTPSPLSWKTVTVFISSTFNDMHAERDYLVKRVFPELREWCEQRKLRLVDIDLRWGVTEADATSRNTVKVCLKRIDESRPFFLCFLGQRRGWVPEKGDIAADTCEGFENLRTYIGKNSVTEMEIEHAVIAPMNGQQRAENSFFYLREPSYLDDLPVEPAFIRNTYTNEGIQNADKRKVADEELQIWREVKIPATGRPIHHYTATWNLKEMTPEIALPLQCPSMDPQNQVQWKSQWRNLGIEPASLDLEDDPDFAEIARTKNEEITTGRLGTFSVEDKDLAAVILKDLKEAIEHRFPKHMVARMETPLQKEIDQQEQFLELNCTGFIRRTGDFDALDKYVASGSQDLFVMTAPAGMGKTMLLANWIRSYQSRFGEDRPIFYRFIGASDGSTTVDSVLRSLLNEIKEAGYLLDEIPVDPLELRNVLLGLLKSIGSRTRLLIVIDALNQLESGLKDLTWLPKKLPTGVQVIVSFKREEGEAEEIATDFRRILPETYAEVRPFESAEDRKALVATYLDQYLKKLDDILVQVLIESPGAGNPLYLKVVLSDLRVYGSFSNLSQKIRNDFGISPIEAFGAVLQRLERDPAFTAIPFEAAVPLLFGLISHARVGLSEQELVSLFAQEMSGCGNDAFLETIRLLLRQVRPFIAIRDGRFDFFYDSFRLAALARYEGGDLHLGQRSSLDWHRSLAGYFEQLPAWVSRDEMHPTLRRAAELPYHLAWAGMADHLADLVLQYDLLESVVDALGPYEAICDIGFVLSPPESPERVIPEETLYALSLIQNTLRLSEHVLTSHSDQLPSQLHGRLLGSNNEKISRMLDESRAQTRRPWLRPVLASLTPPGGPFVWTLVGHTGRINAVAVTPDGRRAVSASDDHTLKVWDLVSGRELHTLAGHIRSVEAVVVTPDGRYAVSGSHTEDKTRTPTIGGWPPIGEMKIWDLTTYRETATFKGHTLVVNALAITPNGRYLISASADKTLKVWELETRREIWTLEGHTSKVKAVAVSPDGRIAVSGSHDGTLKVWDLATGKETATLGGDITYITWVDAIAVTPDGCHVVSASGSRGLLVWDLATGREIETLRWDRSHRSVAVTPDGRHVISGYDSGEVVVGDLTTGQKIATFEGHTEGVWAVAITADGQHVVSGSSDNTLKVWDLTAGLATATSEDRSDRFWVSSSAMTPDGRYAVLGGGSRYSKEELGIWDLDAGQEIASHEGHTSTIRAVAVTLDGRSIISGYQDGTLIVLDLATGRKTATMTGHAKEVIAIAVTPDGRSVISGSGDCTLKVWDLATGLESATLKGHTKYISAIAVTADSRYVVSGSSDSEDGILKVWDLTTYCEIATLRGHTKPIDAIKVMPDGRHVVSGSKDGTLKVWDVVNGRETATLARSVSYSGPIAMTPDGRYVVTGSYFDNTLKVWDLKAGRETMTLKGHTGGVTTIAVTPDGRYVVSGSSDHSLKIWNFASGQVNATFKGHTDSVRAVAITPDGRHAISGSSDTTLRIWDLVTGREIHTLAGHTNEVYAVAVTPDGRLAVSGSSDMTLKVWDIPHGRETMTLKGHSHIVAAVAVTPDGRYAVSGSWDNTVKVWDLSTGQIIASLASPASADRASWVQAVSVTPDGRYIISGSNDGPLKVWDFATGREIAGLRILGGSITAIAITPDSRLAILGYERYGQEKSIKIWDLKSSRISTVFGELKLYSDCFAVAPDGRSIVSGGERYILKVYNIASGWDTVTLNGHTGRLRDVTVTQDGQHAISGSWDMTLKVWDLAAGKAIAEFTAEDRINSYRYSERQRSIIAGDSKGRIHLLRIENLSSAPYIITPLSEHLNEPPRYQCPCCMTWVQIQQDDLGLMVTCPSCSRALRLNPFVMTMGNENRSPPATTPKEPTIQSTVETPPIPNPESIDQSSPVDTSARGIGWVINFFKRRKI